MKERSQKPTSVLIRNILVIITMVILLGYLSNYLSMKSVESKLANKMKQTIIKDRKFYGPGDHALSNGDFSYTKRIFRTVGVEIHEPTGEGDSPVVGISQAHFFIPYIVHIEYFTGIGPEYRAEQVSCFCFFGFVKFPKLYEISDSPDDHEESGSDLLMDNS